MILRVRIEEMRFREITQADVPMLFVVRTATRENSWTHEQLAEVGITEESVSAMLDTTHRVFSGDGTIRAMGWKSDGTQPLWRIEQDLPLPFTLLSVATEISVNG